MIYNNATEILEVETNFAVFDIIRTANGIFESHCGYSKGCIYSDPIKLDCPLDTSLDEIAKDYIEIYGEKQ